MTMAEIERFVSDLKFREPLRNRAFQTAPPRTTTKRGKCMETLPQRAAAFAAAEGFHFSVNEARAYLKAKAAAQGERVTYRHIDSLPADVFFPFAFFREIYLVQACINKPSAAAPARARRSYPFKRRNS
jgi:hypothetical protein